jgi:hypothetical protein
MKRREENPERRDFREDLPKKNQKKIHFQTA